MTLSLRAGSVSDAPVIGEICYRAFKVLADQHSFTPDFPIPDAAIGLLKALAGYERFFAAVAEVSGKIVGSNFLDERNPIAGVFPGPGILAPTCNGELMRWCLGEGLRITQTMTLMTRGLYNQPVGAWLPSVLY